MPLPGPTLRAEDVPALCQALVARYRRGVREVRCDLSLLTLPDLPTLEALARMALTARRQGGSLRLTGATPALRALLDLVGLVELLGQPEQREPPGGVQEGVQPDDAAL
ncbi:MULTISPECIES: STAS domain-containing protein [Streptomyces]|uniref:STAS domain-containing protein n=1 Tax=Streptomyces TaxID=1883 RepID=UPI0009A47F51|nr:MULTISPECIES: STAS domain-containing protein [Streptomyces]